MHPERRMAYLEAIGIDLWVSRRDSGASAAAGRAPSAAASERDLPPAGETAARWEAMRSEVLKCTRCPLHLTRTQGVVGVGPKRADWLVIGAGSRSWGWPASCWMPCCAPSVWIARPTSISPTY